jgi:membrane-associated protease RseP (regulator of RpoE activity)
MKFNSTLSGAVGVVFVAVVTVSPLRAQDRQPSPAPMSRYPWPDSFVLRGPGSQIGASFRDLSPAEARSAAAVWTRLFVDRGGVLIDQVRADSPASRAGLMKGDRITVFDGQRVRNANDLALLIEETPPGWTVNLTVVRDGKVRELSIIPTL